MAKNKQAQQRRREERARVAMGQRPKRGGHGVALAVAAVVIVLGGIGAMVAVRAVTGSSSSAKGTPRSTVPASVLQAVSSVPTAAFDRVGLGKQLSLPVRVSGSVPRVDGKPAVVYLGAEYCPYCAAERWALVAALSRFGRFSGLGATHSAAADVFPNTATFSFHGASYSSRYISFQGVETLSNKVVGNAYAPLDTPTSLQKELFSRYDGPPYFSSTGAIPFIDFGNRYAVSGAGYLPSLLAGLNMSQIAGALHDPTSPISQGVLGTANSLSAAVCSMTGQRPAGVCTTSGVQAATTKLAGG